MPESESGLLNFLTLESQSESTRNTNSASLVITVDSCLVSVTKLRENFCISLN